MRPYRYTLEEHKPSLPTNCKGQCEENALAERAHITSINHLLPVLRFLNHLRAGTNNDCVVLRTEQKIFPLFFVYFLLSPSLLTRIKRPPALVACGGERMHSRDVVYSPTDCVGVVCFCCLSKRLCLLTFMLPEMSS